MTTGKIETACRCCGLALVVPEEDALDLCGRCFKGKGGDTDEPCAAHRKTIEDAAKGFAAAFGKG